MVTLEIHCMPHTDMPKLPLRQTSRTNQVLAVLLNMIYQKVLTVNYFMAHVGYLSN